MLYSRGSTKEAISNAKSTGKHIKRLQHRCIPVNIAKSLIRTTISQNICEQLLLLVETANEECFLKRLHIKINNIYISNIIFE